MRNGSEVYCIVTLVLISLVLGQCTHAAPMPAQVECELHSPAPTSMQQLSCPSSPVSQASLLLQKTRQKSWTVNVTAEAGSLSEEQQLQAQVQQQQGHELSQEHEAANLSASSNRTLQYRHMLEVFSSVSFVSFEESARRGVSALETGLMFVVIMVALIVCGAGGLYLLSLGAKGKLPWSGSNGSMFSNPDDAKRRAAPSNTRSSRPATTSSLAPGSEPSLPSAQVLPEVRRPPAGSPQSEQQLPSILPPLSTSMLSPRFLCPTLAVPQGTECLLAVTALETSGRPKTLEVLDLSGTQVLQAQLSRAEVTGRPSAPTTQITLVPQSNLKQPLAHVRPDPQGGRCMVVHEPNGEIYAQIAPDQPRRRYVLSGALMGPPLVFEGTPSTHTMTVSSESRGKVSDSEPCALTARPGSTFYKIRAFAGVDIGLVLCGYMAIDLMEKPAGNMTP
eukprot:gnl/TRDRNA2_/TRDRNA2_184498_c0_seq1.p1 gnl/TRDRNA2_/TRDRNA2_184498_c0~~gnl/TRDRNA2_/TRDRNA2_184498_c0_seq1.p1  ORF type:complete len:448 (-),score=48.88 gnl/TRDRNA2_/TRDRNA2_184498_c0_seq1:117-1460(-)